MTVIKPNSETQSPGTDSPQEVQPQTPAETRAEFLTEVQKENLKKLEEEKSTKDRKRISLQTESQAAKASEGWVNKDKGSGPLDGIAQGQIDSTVEEKFTEKSAEFSKYNISGTNLAFLKQAAKDLVFDYYCKNGRDVSGTKSWVESTLAPRLTAVFEKMNTIMADPKKGFKSPLEVLQAFSDFSQLDLISGGTLKLGSIKSFMVFEQGSLDTYTKNFEEYLNLGLDINRINGDIAKIKPGPAPQGTTAPAAPATPATPTTPTTPAVAQTPPVVPGTPQTPASPNKPPDTIPAKVEVQPPKTPDTLPAAPPTTPTVTPPTTPTAKPPDTPTTTPVTPPAAPAAEVPVEIKTGNAFLDTLIGFVKWLSPALYSQLGSFLKKLGMGGAAKIEFAGLDDNEKTEGIVLKEIAKAFDLKPEIMTKLFSDPEQMKRVLKNKKDNNITDWEIYFKTYLNSEEQQKLKTETTLKSNEIADMLISKLEPGQPPSSKPNTIAPPTVPSAPAAPQTPAAGAH